MTLDKQAVGFLVLVVFASVPSLIAAVDNDCEDVEDDEGESALDNCESLCQESGGSTQRCLVNQNDLPIVCLCGSRVGNTLDEEKEYNCEKQADSDPVCNMFSDVMDYDLYKCSIKRQPESGEATYTNDTYFACAEKDADLNLDDTCQGLNGDQCRDLCQYLKDSKPSCRLDQGSMPVVCLCGKKVGNPGVKYDYGTGSFKCQKTEDSDFSCIKKFPGAGNLDLYSCDYTYEVIGASGVETKYSACASTNAQVTEKDVATAEAEQSRRRSKFPVILSKLLKALQQVRSKSYAGSGRP